MTRQLLEITLTRTGGQAWGFRILGGRDEGLLCTVEKIHGLMSPACKGGLKVGDVLVSVQGVLVTLMTHPEIVEMIRAVKGDTITLSVERGDHIRPNLKECFPVKTTEELEQMEEEDRKVYYEEAMRRGLDSRLQVPFFTTVGKSRVKTPKYNNPRSLYSDDVMDEMVSGTTAINPDKLDPNSKAFEKLKNAKKFDPKRSSVLEVLNEQMKKNPDVDSQNENDTGRKI